MTRARILNMWIAAIGLGVFFGVFVTFDPYLLGQVLRFVEAIVGSSWTEYLKLLPFELSGLLLLLIGGAFLAPMFLPTMARFVVNNKELSFVAAILIGYQTTALKVAIVDASEVAIGLFLALMLLDEFSGREVKMAATPIDLLNILLLASVLLSSINGLSVSTFRVFVKALVIFFLLFNFLYSKELVPTAVKIFIAATSLSSAFGIVQEIAYMIDQTLLVGAIPEDVLMRMFESTPLGPMFRVPALMEGYRIFAIILGVAIPLAISLLMFPNTMVKARWERRLLYGECLLMLVALGLTLAKDVVIGLFLALALLSVIRFSRFILHFAAVGLVGVAVLLLLLAYLPGGTENFYYLVTEVPKAERERIVLDREGILGLWRGDYFWLGRGLGRGFWYTSHVLLWPAHNAFILAADELGMIGFALYAGLFLWGSYRLLEMNLSVRDPVYLPVARGLLAGWIVYIVGSQFQASFVEPFLWMVLALIESTALILKRREESLAAQLASA